MYIITFYSFKGGVGRTMALVNSAAELARRGRKVLLVDFDLEAPGLSTYNLLRPKKPHPGIVEYVTEFRHTRRSPLVTDFIYETGPVGKKGGRLWVMPAGRGDADYRHKLNTLSWRTLYRDEEGFLLFEDTRLQWEAELRPDYVLIDARTGHTDIEGICTRQLADAVVVVFYPNEQNLVGLREVCKHIRAEAESGLKKQIKLQFVASNVPDLDDEDLHLRRNLNQFCQVLGNPLVASIPVIHRNETLQMLAQPIFVLQRPRSRLAREYRSLVSSLQLNNLEDRDGALLFLREVQKKMSRLLNWSDNGSWQPGAARQKEYQARMIKITEHFLDDAEVLLRVAEYFQRHDEPAQASTRFDRALQLQPDCAEALFHRSFCRRQLGDPAGAAKDLLRYLREHGTKAPVSPPEPEDLKQAFLGIFGGLKEFRSYILNLPDAKAAKVLRLLAKKDTIGKQAERNKKALLELLAISLSAFLKGLDLPAIPVGHWRQWEVTSHHFGFWLVISVERLIQQRRWSDTIEYLEGKVKELIAMEAASPVQVFSKVGGELLGVRQVPTSRQASLGGIASAAFRFFYLVIANWGSGESSKELFRQALVAYQAYLDASYDDLDTADFQRVALLHWGVGEIEKAEAALDRALARLDETGNILDGVSYWTFQTTTPREYRADCEEMRRMIRGEGVQPAFLRESDALRKVGENEVK